MCYNGCIECERCGTEHDGSFGTGRFCSRACANSRQWNEEDKRKKSESAKKSEKVKIANKRIGLERIKNSNIDKPRKRDKEGKILISGICPICGKEFSSESYTQVYCSKRCWLDDKEQKYCKPRGSGGARKGAGHGKPGYYNGFQCDSTYELAYVIWCNENGLEIERNKEYWEYFDPGRNGTFKFYPDFIVDGKLVEIKGYHTPVVDLKMNAVRNADKEINILYKDDLKDAFDIACKITGLSKLKLYEAYDDYKPSFEIECKNCGIVFYTERKNAQCCSLRCSGQLVAKRNKLNKEAPVV